MPDNDPFEMFDRTVRMFEKVSRGSAEPSPPAAAPEVHPPVLDAEYFILPDDVNADDDDDKEKAEPEEKPAVEPVEIIEKVPEEWNAVISSNVKWDDVAGLENVKNEIKLKVIYPYTHPDKAAHYGIKPGGGILLYGPPGTGKTHLAKAMANEVDAKFYFIKPSELMKRSVGDSEKKVQNLFKDARSKRRAVIFIDEVDAIMPRRKSTTSTVMKRVVTQILTELDGIDSNNRNILIVGATNEPWAMDRAVLRPGRFDERIYVPPPDAKARKQIFELNLRGKPTDGLDLEALAEMTEGYSGADIKHICEKASSIPFMESISGGKSRDVTMGDIMDTLEEVGPSVYEKTVDKYSGYVFEEV